MALEDTRHIRKRRHVNGMKLASIVQACIIFVGLIYSVLIASWYSEVAEKLWLLYQIALVTIFAIIAIFVNARRYNLFLILVLAVFIIGPFLRVSIFNIEGQAVGMFELMGGRLLDYSFVWAGFGMIIGVMHANFYLACFIILWQVFLTLFGVYNVTSNSLTFFSTDYSVIAQEIFSMHFGIFSQNIILLIFSAAALIVISLMMERNLEEATQQERSNTLLGRYFSPEVRQEIESSNFSFDSADNEEKNIAILFTDIVGFTKLSEGLKPKEVLDLLSEYQTKMVAAIFQHGGSVDKFIGDSVMATFGTPVSRGNDCQNAFNCIRQMQISMREWEQERTKNNLPTIEHRIGLHFGPCFVGNVGSEDRVEFTVIGDAVNVASRICDACKETKSEILLSDDAFLRLNEKIKTEILEDVQLRGKSKKINLHRITV